MYLNCGLISSSVISEGRLTSHSAQGNSHHININGNVAPLVRGKILYHLIIG